LEVQGSIALSHATAATTHTEIIVAGQPKTEILVQVIIPASTLVFKIKSKAKYNSKSFIKQ
jgi:hypothetical protein